MVAVAIPCSPCLIHVHGVPQIRRQDIKAEAAGRLPVSTAYHMWEKEVRVIDSQVGPIRMLGFARAVVLTAISAQFMHESYYGASGVAPLMVATENTIYGADEEDSMDSENL